MRKNIKHLVGVAVFALSVTYFSCTPKKQLSSITLTCETGITYFVGDRFLDYTNVQLSANYSNGTVEPISLSDAQLILKYNGNNFSISMPFPYVGNYSVYAIYKGLNSNSFNFTVMGSESHVYATSIDASGPSEVSMNSSVQYQVTVQPSDCTEEVIVESTNTAVATVDRLNRTTFRVNGLAKGSTVLTFKVKHSEAEDDYLIKYVGFNVTDIYVTSITPKGPNKIGIGSSVQVSLDVSPSNFTTSISCTSSNTSIATVSKIDDKTFTVNGVGAGNVNLEFTSPRGSGTPYQTTYPITVQNIAKTTIQQTYNEFNRYAYDSSSSYYDFKLSGCPTLGNPKLLIIPIWFSDSANFIGDGDASSSATETAKANIREDITKAFFGSQSEMTYHSVASYYKEESQNRVNITGTVSGWYNVSQTASTYAEGNTASTVLTTAATAWYFNNHSSDPRTNYDSNGDGILDAVIFIYAAPDYITYKRYTSGYGEGKENFWAYVSNGTVLSPSTSSPVLDVYMWVSYDFMYSKATAQTRTGNIYGYDGNTTYYPIDSHTFIHEMGHMFGLEDYYDYASTVSHAGRYSMQDCNICGHDPFSVMSLGWANPYIPTTSTTITINDFQSSHELILLTPSWNSYNSVFDEYLLLELYTPTGLNKFEVDNNYMGWGKAPNAVGIRLWHVNATLWKKSGTFTTNVAVGEKINNAFNNTSKSKADGGRDCNAKPVATYQEYSMLHLVRSNTSKKYDSNDAFVATDLFTANSNFSMEFYKEQFVNGFHDITDLTLDFGQTLGWTFAVNEINSYAGTDQYSAEIILTKL